ncbi:F0F1 ATP synthase subunit alpha [Enterobacteriaceae endosymbiont of Plateumaris braccata]|uniref:F0F1 ATP synthase subunit alpha n=1 Tax=Enterobacteriaceae endosymbiont of Plateumaris braccata TaxID=2675793 RepID=UPI001448FB93|nr:F0F1 ATP synthase subunit alpha [Enterobacteriaceae endosymbiont of Plateumaris braccata]QJC28353.1 F0F1 ATP synthase subunit alpha [Enterobacteriaceae endosymbiont of Plateumaris braccata]
MKLKATEISELIKNKINDYNVLNQYYNEGIIISIADGIIKIYGLSDVKEGEIISLPEDTYAIALNLEIDFVSAVVLGSYVHLIEGMKVRNTGSQLSIPVGKKLMGRIIDTLGNPIDGKGNIDYEYLSPIEVSAPTVIDRCPVNQPLQTGYKFIDAIIPIGKGQRQLIIGDRQTGKTTLAIDTIINQKHTNVKCIYVGIGQKQTTIAYIKNILEINDVLKNTIIIVASASDTAILQYLVPYAGCTIGEYFRDRGEDALIIYDDLSKQSIAYRQVSLLLRRPPGREAFPGDIFYIHSRLLERSSRVNSFYVEKFTKGNIKGKTGSLTAFPIVETQAGDISSFIPTNIISITDGQIFLDKNLFNKGIRPAIDPGISVSRVGSTAQNNIIKKLSSNIRLILAQYRELAIFSQFSSELDKKTTKYLTNGKKIVEILKQKPYKPLSVINQILILFAIYKKYIDLIDLKDIPKFEYNLINYTNLNFKEILYKINKNCIYNKDIENQLNFIFNDFFSHFK